MAEHALRRGDLYWVDWSPSRGSEPSGRRPALIVQRNAGNQAVSYPNTVVVAVSRQGHEIPFHVRLKPNKRNGLTDICYVKCEQIMTISKARLGNRLGALSNDEMDRVNQALRLNLALDDGDESLH